MMHGWAAPDSSRSPESWRAFTPGLHLGCTELSDSRLEALAEHEAAAAASPRGRFHAATDARLADA